MAQTKPNPLFTRSEKRRVRRKIAHKVKGAARKGLARLFGIPLSPGLGGKASSHRRSTSRPASSGAGVRGDVLSALTNLGYKRPQAEKMIPREQSGEGFESLFRRAVSKNPGELVIFGNPEKVYRRKLIQKNPIFAPALAQGLSYAAASKIVEAAAHPSRKIVTRAAKKNRPSKRLQNRKRNSDELGQAKDLFQQFHKRGPAGVFNLQRSEKKRQDYTILGPLVALGINAEKFDQINPREDDVVYHYDKLPHLAFLTQQQLEQVKRVLGDPQKYLKNVSLLASSPNGKQLYVISQEPLTLDLSRFDTDATKDYVDVGEATFVVYIAKKPHEVQEHVHILSDEGGIRPRVVYDQWAKEIFFIGGSYRVEAPGIID